MLLLFPICLGRQLLQPTRCSLDAASLSREYPMFPRGLFGGLFLKPKRGSSHPRLPGNCEEQKPRRSKKPGYE